MIPKILPQFPDFSNDFIKSFVRISAMVAKAAGQVSHFIIHAGSRYNISHYQAT
ncbi:hypothetical protein HYV82_03955 [Candidatus Woesearchaeota archaeon]|nr:hypothetical protein [Candidatus Woesearchaeota archaeon]